MTLLFEANVIMMHFTTHNYMYLHIGNGKYCQMSKEEVPSQRPVDGMYLQHSTR